MREKHPLEALVSRQHAPSGFVAFLRQEAERGRPIGTFRPQGALAYVSWAVDGLLILIPTLVLTVTAAGLPYCSECWSWYRTVRSRRIGAATAGRLAVLTGTSALSEPRVRSPRYRMIACRGGCGPTGLALFWSDPAGDFYSGYCWLSPQERTRILEALDSETEIDSGEKEGGRD